MSTHDICSLSLTHGERDAVYKAVINLVEAWLEKAESLRGHRSAEESEE
ncbi:MAG: hypothetical protein HY347_07120 [candidate division NC10 bacterium]|nr:hypothetical protein [candidate division NC10 bacterium]